MTNQLAVTCKIGKGEKNMTAFCGTLVAQRAMVYAHTHRRRGGFYLFGITRHRSTASSPLPPVTSFSKVGIRPERRLAARSHGRRHAAFPLYAGTPFGFPVGCACLLVHGYHGEAAAWQT
ncbi:uncharacterized protein CTRU02_208455 [Colletotrichum truncatum]|uniref:Uncharacterized protein n=1 Tax=Colletotrichum truncatum TaxID=5467 RepID=A0ACC3YWC9_COLTU|nr:uncharacterized protein CTRU02_10208 [Colletotrichum truncatum]KAF6787412.1 hypothetical protein CTRU02_10208 [Colletotrichum truncatum]